MGRTLHSTATTIRKLLPGHIIRHQHTRLIMQRFADALGLVYFGYVDQRDDEHRLVRGSTVSTTHVDHHYTVGSFGGYDVSVVVRRDSLQYNDKRLKEHYWTILTVDLHHRTDLPHTYIAQHSIRSEVLSRIAHLTELPSSGDAFSTNYSIYSSMGSQQRVLTTFSDEVREAIQRECIGESVEIIDDTIYIYLIEKHPSRSQLDRLMRTGIWLAQVIDAHQVTSAN